MLAQELLARMYLVSQRTVNYTAMLLAFCKDADPREGLGKALTLAMGVRVCTDTAEGERYVEELVEQKRRVREMKLNRDYLREEANKVIRNDEAGTRADLCDRVWSRAGLRARHGNLK